jgi:hypothetical protein
MLTCCDIETLPSRRSERHEIDIRDLKFTTEAVLVHICLCGFRT